jgi:cytochrome c-type biogenesis protein
VTSHIESLSPSSAGLAFLAGLVSFLSPCVLPLLPVYLSFVSGVSVEALASERGKVLRVSLAFVAGFTLVFMLLGAGAGELGGLLRQYRHWLTVLAGALLVLSGLAIVGLVHVPTPGLSRLPRMRGVPGAFLVGMAVAIGWTPCVGYALGAILTMAGAAESAWSGALLLFIYSLGLGVPFLLAAVAFGWVARRLVWFKRHYRGFQIASGAVLIVFGVLFITGSFDYLSRLLSGWNPFKF